MPPKEVTDGANDSIFMVASVWLVLCCDEIPLMNWIREVCVAPTNLPSGPGFGTTMIFPWSLVFHHDDIEQKDVRLGV